MVFRSTAFHYIVLSLVILDALLVMFEFLLGVGVLGMKCDYSLDYAYCVLANYYLGPCHMTNISAMWHESLGDN